MSRRFETTEYTLTESSIDEIAGSIDRFLGKLRLEKQNRIRIRLVMEDILLRIRTHAAEPTACTLELGRRLGGQPCIELLFDGERYDPTAEQESEDGWSRRLLVDMGFAPSWSWRGGRNVVQLRIRAEKRRTATALPLSVLLGAGLGAAGMALPAAVRDTLMASLLVPIFNAFLGLMVTLVGLTLFLSICCAMFSMGDTVAFGRYGKRMLLRFVGRSFLVAALVTAVYQPFFRFADAGLSDPGALLSALLRLIFSILPTDPVTPFWVNDSLQLIFLGTVTGLGLIVLGDRASLLKTAAGQASSLVGLMMEWFSRLTPLFVAITIIRQIWLGEPEILLRIWKPFVIYAVMAALLLTVKLMRVSIREKVPARRLVRKLWPAFVIALTTASASAAYGESMDTTVRRLGVSERLAGFALPVGSTMYMPGSVCAFLLTAFYLAEAYQVQVDYAWFIMAAITCTMMAIALPPVPGAGIGCYSIMLTQLGIPAEGLVAAATLDVFFDFIAVAMDNTMLQLELVLQADAMELLNHELLERE